MSDQLIPSESTACLHSQGASAEDSSEIMHGEHERKSRDKVFD